MYSNDSRYVMVFNGEVYNYLELKQELTPYYTFKSQTDSEVVLAAWIRWGEDCLDKFIGMFSFAIWDTLTETLFVARDRFGVKPFYYSVLHNTFRFASEIKALWASGISKQKNDIVWANYFCYGSYGLPHETFWQDISQLPGGHLLTFSKTKGLHIKQWYFFTERIHTLIETADTAISKTYEELLRESIKLRFRSDVPVGINVSGGLDSSTLLALVHQYGSQNPVEAYTFYTGDERYDELPWVQQLINQTGNPLHACKLSVEEIPDLVKNVTAFQDEPFGGIPTLAYAKVFERALRNGTKVLLDGQGMDEAWAGYDYYHNNNNQTTQGLHQSPYKPEILEGSFRALATPERYPTPFTCELMNLQYRDLFCTKIPRALRFNDRISMMYSTELREPFLDHRLVELAFSRPRSEKYVNGQTKWLLRNLVQSYMGTTISMAPKRALQTPQREWLSGELKPFVEASLESLEPSAYFKKGELRKQYEAFCANPVQSVNIWQYISLAQLMDS
jgi:asparagine synthase (glutamine-hydrolysing)